MDLLVTGGTLLTMADDRLGIVDDGAVGITDGRLSYVGSAAEADETAASSVLDATDCVVTPGFVNAHAHTTHTLVRGAAQDVPEIEWMRRTLEPVAAGMTDADRVVGCRLGVLESVASGVTTVCEYASGVGELVEAVYEPLGVRVVATETIHEVGAGHSGDPDEPYPFDESTGDAAEERAESLFDEHANDPLITPMYGPQALDMVRAERFERLASRAEARDAKLHVHVAQGEREARQIRARYGGRSTVEVLEEIGVANERLVAAHLHGATDVERGRLADAGVAMVGCPSSIASIDGVVPPLVEYANAGGTVALGTDQAPGPGSHDFGAELRTAALLSKTSKADPTAFPAWRALRAGCVGGAEALGLDVGRLVEGTPADLVVFDPGTGAAPFVTEPFHTAVPNLVYGSPQARDVVIAGEFVVRDGTFVDADVDEVVAEATERARRVFSDRESDWRDAGSALVSAVDDGWL